MLGVGLPQSALYWKWKWASSVELISCFVRAKTCKNYQKLRYRLQNAGGCDQAPCTKGSWISKALVASKCMELNNSKPKFFGLFQHYAQLPWRPVLAICAIVTALRTTRIRAYQNRLICTWIKLGTISINCIAHIFIFRTPGTKPSILRRMIILICINVFNRWQNNSRHTYRSALSAGILMVSTLLYTADPVTSARFRSSVIQ